MSSNLPKVLITGASGFIGLRLTSFLKEKGYEVRGTGRSKPTDWSTDVEYTIGEITSPADCDPMVQGVDAIVHCAGKAGTWGDRDSYFRANVVGTQNLIRAAKKANVKRLINISSPSIYFDYKDQFQLKETDLPSQFSNAYAETKYLAELEVQRAHDSSFHTLSLRPRGVIGAGDRNWMPRIIEMRQAGKLVQVGEGKNLSDFTSVSNLIELIEKILVNNGDVFGETYNVTNGEPVALWDFVEQALIETGLDGQRKKVPYTVAMPLAKLSEKIKQWRRAPKEPTLLPIKVGVANFSMTLDISKAQKRLAYKPKQNSKDAIAEFATWWKNLNQ